MTNKKIILAALVALISISASAQQVTTMYFLDNAPMRHTINPALQPVSGGYISIAPLGWSSFSFGNNSLTISDVLFVDQETKRTITPLHPHADRQKFLSKLHSMMYFNGDITLGLLNMGFRIKDHNYFTLGINERIEFGQTIPKPLYSFFLGGGMEDLSGGLNTISLSGMGTGTTVYTEISGGYSHKVSDHWTIGFKIKALIGQAYAGLNAKTLNLYSSPDAWQLDGKMSLDVAAPVDMDYLTSFVDAKTGKEIYDSFVGGEGTPPKVDFNKLVNMKDIKKLLKPSGFGAALDFGIAWNPVDLLQISVGLTDLGVIYWANGTSFECTLDSAKAKFEGAGEVEYRQFMNEEGTFNSSVLMDTVTENLKQMLTGVTFSKSAKKGFLRMTSARLNVGLDLNFWQKRIGIGVVSATRLYNARLYEEVTVGLAIRPVNWFNIAGTYSLMNNGQYSNFGAGLGFMPYDGINLMIAMDYIPTSYAKMPNSNTYALPDKAKMFNLAFGLSICWGSNRKDRDRDGVWDKMDMCPDTPRGVKVDEHGCPEDSDNDGVPDYQDRCPETPQEARGRVDKYGCILDSDGDGVPDYMDKCPYTPEDAHGSVDENGCPLDSDGDGIPDYMDECPEQLGLEEYNGCLPSRIRPAVKPAVKPEPIVEEEKQPMIQESEPDVEKMLEEMEFGEEVLIEEERVEQVVKPVTEQPQVGSPANAQPQNAEDADKSIEELLNEM